MLSGLVQIGSNADPKFSLGQLEVWYRPLGIIFTSEFQLIF